MAGAPSVRKCSILPHGKPGFTDRISLRKKFWIFGITFIERNDTFPIIEFIHLVVNVFDIIPFVSKESAFRNREKGMCIGEDIKRNSRIINISCCCHFVNGKT